MKQKTKQIPFAPDYYITEAGDIYSKKRGQLKRLSSHVDNSKYHRIQLRVKNEIKSYLVHRLVAITYIPNPQDLPQVNHKDGDKLNNYVSNLEWVTAGDNQRHAYANKLKTSQGVKNSKNILSEKDVIFIYNALLEGSRRVDLAKQFGVKNSTIDSIQNRKNWFYLLKSFPEIPKKKNPEKLSESTVRWICNRLCDEISGEDIVRLATNKLVTIDRVYGIKWRKTYKHITKEYNW